MQPAKSTQRTVILQPGTIKTFAHILAQSGADPRGLNTRNEVTVIEYIQLLKVGSTEIVRVPPLEIF